MIQNRELHDAMIKTSLDLDGDHITTLDMVNFNRTLMRLDNINFFLTLKAFVMYNRNDLFHLMKDLDDEVISRIFYDTLQGINIKESIVEIIMVPALLYCLLHNKIYLITPNFRLFMYKPFTHYLLTNTIDEIAGIMSSYIMNEIKIDMYDITDVSLDEYSEDQDTFEQQIVDMVIYMVQRVLNPSTQLFLSVPGISLDTYNLFKTLLRDHVLSDVKMAMYELGYNGYLIKNDIEAPIKAAFHL